jgi:tetratricopeptide (TPR) repeat protein
VAKAEPSYESAVTEPAPRHRSRTLGGKKVVLEDDKSAPVEPKEDPAQVERARDAYKRGNEKLFAGNSAGAIEAYKESLSIYPGYVAGYRGLGLAYAQEGNNADALKALKTYVKNAPNAHDVPLIMKRIERLEKSPQD